MTRTTAAQKIISAAESNGWTVGIAAEDGYTTIFERGAETVVIAVSAKGTITGAKDYSNGEVLTARDKNKAEKVIGWLSSRDEADYVAADTAAVEFETLTDVCPVCRVHGTAPCVDPENEMTEVDDHVGRRVDAFDTPAIGDTVTTPAKGDNWCASTATVIDIDPDGSLVLETGEIVPAAEPARVTLANGAIRTEYAPGIWDLVTGDSMSGHTIIDTTVASARDMAHIEPLPRARFVIWSNAFGGIIHEGEYATMDEVDAAINTWGDYNVDYVEIEVEDEDEISGAIVGSVRTVVAELTVDNAPAPGTYPVPSAQDAAHETIDPFTAAAPASTYPAPTGDTAPVLNTFTACMATYGPDHGFICSLDMGHEGDHEDHITYFPSVMSWADGYDNAPTASDSHASRVEAFMSSMASGVESMIDYTINLLSISDLNDLSYELSGEAWDTDNNAIVRENRRAQVRINVELAYRHRFNAHMATHYAARQIRTQGFQTIDSDSFAFVWPYDVAEGRTPRVFNYTDSFFSRFLNRPRAAEMPHLDCETLGFKHEYMLMATDEDGIEYVMCSICSRCNELKDGVPIGTGARDTENIETVARIEHFSR